MHTALVICPHADDAAAFLGGTVAKFAAEGWRVVLVRVTDDSKDSVGLDMAETTRINTEELAEAASILGVQEIVELGYATDCLGDVSKVELRERFVYLFRKHKPYAVFSFDPFGIYEGNLDHIVVAQAVEEAYWVSCFDKHHPEHFEEGLKPFSVCERWYYGRNLPGANHVEDITETLGVSIDGLCAHKTMMRNTVNQLRLQAETWGKRVPILDDAVESDLRPLITMFLTGRAQAVAQDAGWEEGRYGEAFRVERFGGFEDLMQANAEPIPGAPEPPRRAVFGEDPDDT